MTVWKINPLGLRGEVMSILDDREQVQGKGLDSREDPLLDLDEGSSIEGDNKDQGKHKHNFMLSGSIKVKLAVTVASILLIIIAILFTLDFVQKKKEEDILEQLENSANENEVTFTYSDEERKSLMQMGYTQIDIENFEISSLLMEDIIIEYDNMVAEHFEANIKPYLDGKSDAYKRLEEYTWLGGEEIDPEIDVNEQENYYSETVNCDFVKVPAMGSQLFTKVVTPKGIIAFMPVTPYRYQTLEDSGNIVVEITYTIVPSGDLVITRVDEIDLGGN